MIFSNYSIVSDNRTSSMVEKDINNMEKLVTYYPLALIIFGTALNVFTFGIFFRPAFRDTHRRPMIHYMRIIAIFDILMLYGWNLDNYLNGSYGISLQFYSVPLCKIFSFWNFFTEQVSAWLRVFISLDRYLALSRLHKTWFSQPRNVLIIIMLIITIFSILNIHFILFACYSDTNNKINLESRFYRIYPLWKYISLVVYNFAPFILMVIFNCGVISHSIRIRRHTTVQNSRIRYRSISITAVITTFLFLLMTTPASFIYTFFSETASYFVRHFFNSVLYTYYVLSFPMYLITFTEFRHEVLLIFFPGEWLKVQPTTFQLAEVRK